MSRIAIIGSGIVGQATGKGMEKSGHSILFVDIDPEVLEQLKNNGYQTANISQLASIQYETSFLCLPTPLRGDVVDLSYFENALPYIGNKLSLCDDYHLVVIRSTVPPATTERLIIPKLELLSRRKAGSDFGVCTNPEFLRHASSDNDFLHPWSIVIGSLDRRSGDTLLELYKRIVKKEQPQVVKTDLKTAEMIKYVQNLYNATKISFSNEIWSVCQKLNINCDTVMEAVTQSAEGMWNSKYGTRGGYPYAGSCLVKDTMGFLSYAKQELGIEMPLLEATIRVNDSLEKNK
jgi:UDPglucose 6-dehydrogenase